MKFPNFDLFHYTCRTPTLFVNFFFTACRPPVHRPNKPPPPPPFTSSLHTPPKLLAKNFLNVFIAFLHPYQLISIRLSQRLLDITLGRSPSLPSFHLRRLSLPFLHYLSFVSFSPPLFLRPLSPVPRASRSANRRSRWPPLSQHLDN